MRLLKNTKKWMVKLLAGLMVAGFMPFTALAQTAEDALLTPLVPLSFTDIAEKVSPVVVSIKTMSPHKDLDLFGGFGGDDVKEFFKQFMGEEAFAEEMAPSMGSGFIWDTEGHVVTNYHMVADAREITVVIGEDEYTAVLVGQDPNTDLALIKLEKLPAAVLPAAVLGDSDAVKVGEWVVAIGSPFGLEKTVTAGIISAKGRVIGFGPYDDFLQTDASINPGNSGGPLINLKGEVVGINTAIVAYGQGLGFAIPINMARKIVTELKETGEVTRGWLGVLIQDVTPEIAEYYGKKGLKGVLVGEVYADSPAAKGGLKAGDIIMELNGEKMDAARALTARVANIAVDETVELKVLRDGKETSVKVKIGKRDEDHLAGLMNPQGKSEPALKNDVYGLSLNNLTPELAQKYHIEEKSGVVVTAVKTKSAAAKAGLKTGDLIKEVNRQKINAVEDYRKAVAGLKPGEGLTLFIWRAGEGFKVVDIEKP